MDIRKLEQICIEDKYSRSDIRERVLKDIGSTLDTHVDKAVDGLYKYFMGNYYPSKNARLSTYERVCGLSLEELVIEICIIILPLRQATSIQTVVGKLAEVLNYPDIWDGIKTAAEIVIVACESDIYDVITARSSESGSIMVQSNFSLERETLKALDLKKYLPPLIIKPMRITNNKQSAYLNKNKSVILGNQNHHDMPLALDALNIASSIALSLDEWVLTQTEAPKKDLDTIEKKEGFKHLQVTSREVYNELIDLGNMFYFEWRFDKRGRMYSSGYHVNIQSTEYKKALINLHNKQVITLE